MTLKMTLKVKVKNADNGSLLTNLLFDTILVPLSLPYNKEMNGWSVIFHQLAVDG